MRSTLFFIWSRVVLTEMFWKSILQCRIYFVLFILQNLHVCAILYKYKTPQGLFEPVCSDYFEVCCKVIEFLVNVYQQRETLHISLLGFMKFNSGEDSFCTMYHTWVNSTLQIVRLYCGNVEANKISAWSTAAASQWNPILEALFTRMTWHAPKIHVYF